MPRSYKPRAPLSDVEPTPGHKWRSRDPRDSHRVIEVVQATDVNIIAKSVTGRKTTIKRINFMRNYVPV